MRRITVLIFVASFALLIGTVHTLAPLVVEDGLKQNAERLAVRWVTGLSTSFDLPGEMKTSANKPSFSLLSLFNSHFKAPASVDDKIEIFNPTNFQDNMALGSVENYVVYTRFGDRFLSGGANRLTHLGIEEIKQAFETVLSKKHIYTVDHDFGKDTANLSFFSKLIPSLENSTQHILVVMIPLFKGDRVAAVAKIEIQPTAFETYLKEMVQHFASFTAAVLVVLSLLVIGMFLRWNNKFMRAGEKAEYLAHYDSLTGTLNRRAISKFFDELEEKDYPEPFTYWAFDVDNFKHINDTYGHPVGDQILREISDRIRSVLSENSIFSRISGDEFVVIVPYSITRLQANKLSDDMINVVKEPMCICGQLIETSVSIGVAEYPSHTMEPKEVAVFADMALYTAKADNKANWKRFSMQISEKIKRERLIMTGLQKALAADELVLHFQPQVDISKGKIVGAEALLRWTHHTLGSVSPVEFIAVAEKHKFITDIDAWVMRKACQTATTWPDDFRIAVNVSPVCFEKGDVVKLTKGALRESGLAPHRLEIEITENILMGCGKSVEETLQELRELGVSIALDDFGTGNSNLSYLTQMPINKLKIDRSFVGLLKEGSTQATVIKALLHLGRDLNVDVLAEGVETYEQMHLLRKFGCVSAQGYLYGKPTPDPFGSMQPEIINQLKTLQDLTPSEDQPEPILRLLG